MSVCGRVSLGWFYELKKKRGRGPEEEQVSSVGSAILESHRIFVTYGIKTLLMLLKGRGHVAAGMRMMLLLSAGTVIKCRLPRSLRIERSERDEKGREGIDPQRSSGPM